MIREPETTGVLLVEASLDGGVEVEHGHHLVVRVVRGDADLGIRGAVQAM